MPETHTSAGLIPFRRNQSERLYLLLKYPQGHWGFPKGHLETGDESLREAAVRELEEETGLAPVEHVEDFRQVLDYWFTMNDKRHHKTVYFFAGIVGSNDVTLSEEHVDYGWFNRDETLGKITYDNEKKLFKNWIEFDESEGQDVNK